MKPRTRSQCLVYSLAKDLPQLTQAQKDFAFDKYLLHVGFANKKAVNCLDCGNSFSLSFVSRNKAVCPSCNTKLTVKTTKKRTMSQVDYFALGEIYNGFQIFRYFKLESTHKTGSKRKIDCYEILQHWINEDGKREIIARRHDTSYYHSSDAWNGFLEIRDKNDLRKYDVHHSFVLPESRIKSEFTKYGIDHNLKGASFIQAIQHVPINPKSETLLKARQYALFSNSVTHQGEIYRYWSSIKICIRNKHIVKDPTLFFDYLDLLNYFRKDLHSPKYLFPKDMDKEHDRLMIKRRAIQKKEALEQRIKKIAREEKEYLEQKSQFLNVQFCENDLTIKVVPSVKYFMEIGDKLKHCVYTNKYYKKDDSLILSAELNGEPIETIEVSLKSMEIIQARGFQNKASEYNSKIIQLVNQNLPLIQERMVV